MISAINTALAGLHTAGQKLDDAAHDIVRAGTVREAAPASSPGTSPPPDTSSAVAAFTEGEGGSLTDSVVAFKEAETLFKASATLIGALNRAEKNVLDILS